MDLVFNLSELTQALVHNLTDDEMNIFLSMEWGIA